MLLAPRLRSAIAALPFAASLVASQQQAPAQAAATNPQTNLPYGAPSAAPVSKWTPPSSAGRQLTLNDLLTWKSIRTPQLSNDGNWFAYILGPNEGDAEVVIRRTAAGDKEWRFPVGDATAGAAGGGRGGAGGSPNLAISGNGKWVAFIEYASSAT